MAARGEVIKLNESTEDLSLNDVLQEVSQMGEEQNNDITAKKHALLALQSKLSDTEIRKEAVASEIQAKDRELRHLAEEIAQTKKNIKDAESQAYAIHTENMGLRAKIEEDEENYQKLLARNNAYRQKIEQYKVAVLKKECQGSLYKQLLEKRALVAKLREERDEMYKSLQDPDGKATRQLEEEVNELKRKCCDLREEVNDRKRLLTKELETHSQLRMDIEIHRKRFEAFMRRLRSQLNRAQLKQQQLAREMRDIPMEVQEAVTHPQTQASCQ